MHTLTYQLALILIIKVLIPLKTYEKDPSPSFYKTWKSLRLLIYESIFTKIYIIILYFNLLI